MSKAKVDEWLHSDRGSPWKHADGGGIVARDMGGNLGMPGASPDPTSGGIGGVTPSTTTMNPMIQGMVQRYASMPTEKLTEMAAMMGGSPQGQIIQRLLMQRRTMPQQNQPPQQAQPQGAPAAPQVAQAPQGPTFQQAGQQAFGQKDGGGTPARATGGDMGISPSQGTPWWTRSEARASDAPEAASGFLHGFTPGRADAINTLAPAGAYVIPADVIAGLGEGNSLSGARLMQEILSTGPHGVPLERSGRGSGPPRAPAPYREQGQFRAGGVPQGQKTPVLLSHGEFVVEPHHVRAWGNGDIKRGHRVFDRFVMEQRKKQVAKLAKLPPPVGAKVEKKAVA